MAFKRALCLSLGDLCRRYNQESRQGLWFQVTGVGDEPCPVLQWELVTAAKGQRSVLET